MKIRNILLILLAAACFTVGIGRLETGRQAQGRQQLEEAVRRAVVSCYATEGFYPPDADYIRDHCGLKYDEDSYVIRYEVFASNLMPVITVLEK